MKISSRSVVGRRDDPMIDRWEWIQGRFGGIFIHYVRREDRDPIPHDHPWPFLSVILRGGYSEHYWPDARIDEHRERTFRRGRIHVFPVRAAHMITRVRPGTVTLCVVGRKSRRWGFWAPVLIGELGQRFIDYEDAIGVRPTEGVS